jgi:diguanylate cyclase
MQFKSLETRIVTLFLVLLIVLQLVGFAVTNYGIAKNARATIQAELSVDARVLLKLMQGKAQALTQGATWLASDYAFRQAISGEDPATLRSALANHGGRINAAFALYIDAERKIKATTLSQTDQLAPLVLPLLDLAEQAGGAGTIGLVQQQVIQIVVVPVKAPILIGWVVMAFPIDQMMVNEMRALSGSDLAVFSSLGKVQASTLNVDSVLPELRHLVMQANSSQNIFLASDEYRVLHVPLDKKGEFHAVLLRSVSAALQPYLRLQWLLFGFTLVALAVAVVASIVTAKRIAQPLKQLAEVAERLGRGDYSAQIAFQRSDEIGALATAFTTMQNDIAQRELKISRLAYWDTLTGLPNRVEFSRQVDLAQHDNTVLRGAVLMLDLDRFKFVNDVLGHAVGDALLQQLALRLQAELNSTWPNSVLARFGGDEFAILLRQATPEQAQQVAGRILGSLEQPLTVEQQTIDVGAGLGIALFPEHGDHSERLLKLVEVAMYFAKSHHSGAVLYDSKIDTSSAQNLSLLTELRHAAEHGEFRLFAQPKISLATGQVVGVEALVRWVHPVRGMVFPDHFIPFAEQTGFIRVLTDWMLQQSAAMCQLWQAQGLQLKVSVNLSTRDLLDQDLPQKFGDILQRHGLQAKSFCLEITESAIMDDPQRAQNTLQRLHDMGADLSIDDFGTGYSSLAYLKRLPVNELKIDKSFVLNMANDAGDTKIVRSTIDLGHIMGLRVVAEGIENVEVWHLLAQLGCDQGQGYFMSRPIAAEQIPAWVAAWRSPAALEGGQGTLA